MLMRCLGLLCCNANNLSPPRPAGLLSEGGNDIVLTSEEVTSEEMAVDIKVRTAISGRAKLRSMWGHTLYHIDDLPYLPNLSDLPDIFTPFKNKVESKCAVREVLASPSQGELPVPAGLPATEEASWERLPLSPAVKSKGLPEPAKNAVLDFEVRVDCCEHIASAAGCEYARQTLFPAL
jgi:deoxyribodipyrimidine photo-lyase